MKYAQRFLAGLTLSVAVLVAGCYSTHVVANRSGGQVVHKPFHHNLVQGLVELEPIDIDRECGAAGAATFSSKQSSVNWLLAVLSNQIYTPMDATMECAVSEAPPGQW